MLKKYGGGRDSKGSTCIACVNKIHRLHPVRYDRCDDLVTESQVSWNAEETAAENMSHVDGRWEVFG